MIASSTRPSAAQAGPAIIDGNSQFRIFFVGYTAKTSTVLFKNIIAQSAMGRKVIQIYYNNAISTNACLERSPAL